jgi:sortase (surface protein transpeptidase)
VLIRTRPDRSLPALIVLIALLAAIAPTAVARTPQATLQAADRADRIAAAAVPAGWSRGVDDDLAAAIRASAHEQAAAGDAETTRVAWVTRPTTDTPTPKARTETEADRATSGGSGSSGASGTYRGKNRVWIPALGINRSISFFSCSSKAYPGDRVYRWGCAGGNNVYLFGHAHSVFKPLHDAYVRGRLKKGMKVIYADGNGKVSTYVVRWWKVTTPDKGAWAYAGQSRPSLTLQTCVGAKSQYRLIVRLTKSG